ncbi:MAG: thiamine-phosphate kinase [Pseudomonadota bacterium]
MQETDWITRYIAPLVTSDGADGLRDDVALITALGPTIATMDTLVEGVHFLTGDPLVTVGQKLVRVNVSDILAKGAEPVEALLSIAWPSSKTETAFAALIAGLAKDLEAFGVSLVGGDLVGTTGPLTLTLTLTGRCIAKSPIRRGGGVPGETLFVSGEIGWGGLGLIAARENGDPETADRYRVPRINPVSFGHSVAEHASASMDVSDGLLIDAARLAQASGCGVEIHLDRVPLASPSEEVSEILAQCTSGDDYQILLSGPSDLQIPGFSPIGQLTSEAGLRLFQKGEAVNAPSILGFEH